MSFRSDRFLFSPIRRDNRACSGIVGMQRKAAIAALAPRDLSDIGFGIVCVSVASVSAFVICLFI